MAKKKIIWLGACLALVILSASFYIFMPEKIRIDFTKTRTIFTLYNPETGKFDDVQGIEYTRIFDGTILMRAKNRNINYTIKDGTTEWYRIAKFKEDIIVEDFVEFENKATDVENVPVSHKACFTNAKGKIFEYLIKNIEYGGASKPITSPFKFGKNMEVTFQDGYHIAKVVNNKVRPDKIIVRYRIKSDYECFDIRLFDPTTTYEITEANVNKAWRMTGQITGSGTSPPWSPGHANWESGSYAGAEYDSTQYSNIEADEGDKNSWSCIGGPAGPGGGWINLWYNFTINEDVGEINSIQVLWNGYDELSEGSTFEFDIWNHTSSAWRVIDITSSSESADIDYGTTFTSGFNDYIVDGILHLGIAGDWDDYSCPFVYVWNGTDYYFDSEAITRHVLPEWTGSQLSRLPSLEPIQVCMEKNCKNVYKLKITEELSENSYIDSVELIKVYHNKNKEVYSGLGQNLWTIQNKIKPISAIDDTGKDVFDLIEYDDEVYWNDGDYSGTNYEDLDGDDIADSTNPDDLYKYLELTFDKPSNAEFIKLNFKVLEFDQEHYIGGNMFRMMDEKGIISQLATDGTLATWFDKNVPAMFWIQIWNGTDWNIQTRVQEFPARKGPDVVYKFNIPNIQTDNLKVRFLGIPNEGGVDYVYADYSKDSKLKTEIIPLTKATFEGEDIMNIVGEADNNFQRLRPKGIDEILFEFEEEKTEKDVTYFLNVTGYYKALPRNTVDISDEEFWRILTEPLFTARFFVYKFKEKPTHSTLYEDYVKVVVDYGEDTSAPTISDFKDNSTASMPINSTDVQINFTILDDTGIDFFRIATNNTDGNVWTNGTLIDANDATTINYIFNDTIEFFPKKGGTYGCQVWGNDTGGYSGVSNIYTITIQSSLDETAPTFVNITHAGSTEDPEFSYWALEDQLYFYRNGTNQSEDYMYIRVAITDNVAISNVTLEWKDENGWTNYTMTNIAGTDYYEYNITNQPTWYGYTFNIYANDTLDNQMDKYTWVYFDYEAGWGTQEEWRKYVGLNAIPDVFDYEQFYLYKATYAGDMTNDRALAHEQPTDGTLTDTGRLLYEQPTSDNEIECGVFVGASVDETIAMDTTQLNNTYLHVWWNSLEEASELRIAKHDYYTLTTGSWGDDVIINKAQGRANVSGLTGFEYDHYILQADIFDHENVNFTDNEINILGFVIARQSGGTPRPSVISTANHSSFIIFNVPDNDTLNNLDTDSDGLNDTEELYIYWTDPRDSDTDNGGESDYSEVLAGRNPLNTSDDFPTITILTPVNNSNFNKSSLDFNVSISKQASWCGISISGNANETMSLNSSSTGANYTNSSIADGSYTFIVSCNDTVNNWGNSGTYNFLIDTVYPSINFTAPTPSNDSSQSNTYIFVNVSVADSNNVSTFIDFDNSLVGWWRMDDVNQTGEGALVYDYSDYGNNGTAQANAKQTDAGYLGKGFEFDGAGDYVDLGNSNSLQFTGPFTVSAWVDTNAISGAHAIAVRHRSGSTAAFTEWAFYFSTPARLYLDISNGSTLHQNAIASLPADYVTGWHMVTGVWNGTSLMIYWDGSQSGAAVDTTISSLATSSKNTAIGSDITTVPRHFFNGTIDDVLIFNRSLTQAEIQGLYANRSSYYLEKNFTSLAEGSHTFKAYTQDIAGNVNETELRTVTVDTTPPKINFTAPTPSDGTTQAETYVTINVSIIEPTYLQEVVFNWNGTNTTIFNDSVVFMMNFDNRSALGENNTYFDDMSNYNNEGDGLGFDGDEIVTGKYGKAFKGTGGDDRINVSGALEGQGIITNKATFSMWVNLSSTGCNAFMSKRDGYDTNNQFGIGTSFDNPVLNFEFSVDGTSNNAFKWGLGNVTVGSWQHHVYVYDKDVTNNVKLYIDGTERIPHQVANLNTPLFQSTSDFYIGAVNNGGVCEFDGTIDDVMIWNIALNSTEVQQLYFINLYKYNQTNWNLEINQSLNSTDGLTEGDYTYQAYASDDSNNWNSTEERTVTIAIEPSINFTIWDGSSWINYALGTEDIEFRCTPTQSNCEPTNQDAGSSQSIYRICNNGTGLGTGVYLNMNETFVNIDMKCDDDYTSAGATVLTTSNQTIHSTLAIDACTDISCWADYSNPTSGGYFDVRGYVVST